MGYKNLSDGNAWLQGETGDASISTFNGCYSIHAILSACLDLAW